jgi:hypothetical protein
VLGAGLELVGHAKGREPLPFRHFERVREPSTGLLGREEFRHVDAELRRVLPEQDL